MIVKLIILLFIVWFGFRIYQSVQNKKQENITTTKVQDMVSCQTCGIHLPASEALKEGGKYFCSQDHLPK